MSLINEALKRADEDKPPAAPADDDRMPPLEPVRSGGGSNRPGRTLLLLAVLGAVAITGGIVWFNGMGESDVPRAALASAPQGPTDDGNELVLDGQPSTPETPEISKPPASPARPARPISPADMARTIRTLRNMVPRLGPPTRSASADKTPNAPPAKPRRETVKATRSSRPVPQPRLRPSLPIDPSRYKVSAIMTGGFGATAVVNGAVVEVGGVIDDAKVIRIGANSVVFEIDGQQFTVGI